MPKLEWDEKNLTRGNPVPPSHRLGNLCTAEAALVEPLIRAGGTGRYSGQWPVGLLRVARGNTGMVRCKPGSVLDPRFKLQWPATCTQFVDL